MLDLPKRPRLHNQPTIPIPTDGVILGDDGFDGNHPLADSAHHDQGERAGETPSGALAATGR